MVPSLRTLPVQTAKLVPAAVPALVAAKFGPGYVPAGIYTPAQVSAMDPHVSPAAATSMAPVTDLGPAVLLAPSVIARRIAVTRGPAFVAGGLYVSDTARGNISLYRPPSQATVTMAHKPRVGTGDAAGAVNTAAGTTATIAAAAGPVLGAFVGVVAWKAHPIWGGIFGFLIGGVAGGIAAVAINGAAATGTAATSG